MPNKIILISEPDYKNNEVNILNNLFELGLTQFNIRKPSFNADDMRNYIIQIPKQYHKYLVLHSHYSLAKEFNLKGIQVGADRITDSMVCNNTFDYIGYSAHSFNEIEKYKNIFSHFFISPIFNSISKKGYHSKFDINELSEFVKQHNNLKIIALGGIDHNTINQIKEINFFAFAVLGAIWNSEDKEKQFIKLIKH